MSSRAFTSIAAGLALTLALAVGAWAHVNRQEGGPGDNTLDGHAHTDRQFGRGGCDELLGRDGSDEQFGGAHGCDHVRGQGGAADAVIVCDDGAGGDHAYGGDGGNDLCIGSLQDHFDLSSCELPRIEANHCAG